MFYGRMDSEVRRVMKLDDRKRKTSVCCSGSGSRYTTGINIATTLISIENLENNKDDNSRHDFERPISEEARLHLDVDTVSSQPRDYQSNPDFSTERIKFRRRSKVIPILLTHSDSSVFRILTGWILYNHGEHIYTSSNRDRRKGHRSR